MSVLTRNSNNYLFIFVREVPRPPHIESSSSSVEVLTPGQTLEIYCIPSDWGLPRGSLSWWKNGVLQSYTDHIIILTGNLTIDVGVYTCNISNSHGHDQRTISVECTLLLIFVFIQIHS
jgi:hypothetical protein